MNPLWFLFGYRTYSVPTAEGKDLLNLCMCRRYVYSHFEADDERIRFRCTERTGKRLERDAENSCLHLTCLGTHGIPTFLYRRRERFGIPLGILIATVVGILLSRMVWSIQVTGNTTVPTSEVLSQLEEAGLSVGTLRSLLDPDDVELKLLMSSDDLSWASVNLKGTVATVQVREKKSADEADHTLKPAHIVAGASGKILYTQILRGNPLVTVGDTVNQGDLLISGVFDSTSVGFRWTRASGHVYAETVQEFRIEIPLHYTETAVSGDAGEEILLSFFGKEIKVFKSTGNPAGSCDTIETVKEYGLSNGKTLPISLHTVRYLTYTDTEKTRTKQQAENLAYYRLAGEIAEWLGEGGSLLRKSVTVTWEEDACILTCTAVGVTDIAVVSEFELDLSQINSPQ